VASAQGIRIAAASDLQFALTEIVKKYQEHYHGKIIISFGSSGSLYAQLTQGAPFDLFFSASDDYTLKLEQAKLIEPGSRYRYAVGRLVIWAHDQLGLDPAKFQMTLLQQPEVTHISLANPDHAPYGMAAQDFLSRHQLLELVQPKLIFGENISQAAQLALSSGSAGIIALSLAISATMEEAGSYWTIPLADHKSLNQEVVILQGQYRPEVIDFYAFIQSQVARDILTQHGFVLP
jgi:molybdate transport system substrate-binding protein